MADAKAGERYQCATCGTQVVIIKTEGAVPQCCGAPMLLSSGQKATPHTPRDNAAAKPAAPRPASAQG
jgi:DNA-directed RNA polymerase subunit RPC12/RpoP